MGSGSNQLNTTVTLPTYGQSINSLIGATTFYNAGITGQNTTVFNIEAGLAWNGHQTLTSLNAVTGPTSSYSYSADAFGATYASTVAGKTFDSNLFDQHATWTAMMIGGRATQTGGSNEQIGIAPGTNLMSGAISTGWSGSAYSGNFGLSLNSFLTPYVAAFGKADVVSSSWTDSADTTGTGFYAVSLDALAFQNPHTTFVVAAGNSGPTTDTAGVPGSGYNTITVGALTAATNYGSADSFSSRGPQDYGYLTVVNNQVVTLETPDVRAPVDLVAPGDSLISAHYGGQTGGNNTTLTGSAPIAATLSGSGTSGYDTGLAGTSFATPITSGAVALLDSASKSYFNTPMNSDSLDSRVIKAVLMNSADKISGWNNGQTAVAGVVTTAQALDYTLGAGRLDLNSAFTQYLTGTKDVLNGGQHISGNQGNVQDVGWDLGTATLGGKNDYFIDTRLAGGSTMAVTLDWFRDRSLTTTTNGSGDIYRRHGLRKWRITTQPVDLFSAQRATESARGHVDQPVQRRATLVFHAADHRLLRHRSQLSQRSLRR